jgi:hypothetical protein
MFTELTDDLLDLRATEKGYGNALFAAVKDEDGCSSCCSSCWSLCCTI